MKRLLALLLLLLFALTVSVGAVSLYVDTDLIQTDVPPAIVDGRTMVPMRAIFEALGAEVGWDGDTRTATGTLGEQALELLRDARIYSIFEGTNQVQRQVIGKTLLG